MKELEFMRLKRNSTSYNFIYITMILVIMGIVLSGCVSRTRVEPKERIITKTVTQYTTVPESLLNCPLPPIVDPLSIETEAEYNTEFVAQLYANNTTCYDSIQSIINWNRQIESIREESGPVTTSTLEPTE